MPWDVNKGMKCPLWKKPVAHVTRFANVLQEFELSCRSRESRYAELYACVTAGLRPVFDADRLSVPIGSNDSGPFL